jgi:hypothetical protein
MSTSGSASARRRDPAGGRRGGGRLELQPQVVDLEHVAHRQRRDQVAAARFGDHERLRPEASERGADRGLREPELGDQLRLGDGRARFQLEPHDRVPQPLVGGRSGGRGLHGQRV